MNDKTLEEMAALEHIRWSKWQKYLHSVCTRNDDGSLIIPSDKIKRWERQIATPYEELSEAEKESDRIEARKTLKIVQVEIAQAKLEVVEEIRKVLNAKPQYISSSVDDAERLHYLKNKLTELKSNLVDSKEKK